VAFPFFLSSADFLLYSLLIPMFHLYYKHQAPTGALLSTCSGPFHPLSFRVIYPTIPCDMEWRYLALHRHDGHPSSASSCGEGKLSDGDYLRRSYITTASIFIFSYSSLPASHILLKISRSSFTSFYLELQSHNLSHHEAFHICRGGSPCLPHSCSSNRQ
jgi:hypothetical protein